MNQNRKYFGMTMTQIGILAGMAGFAILLFCIVGILVVQNGIRAAPQLTPPTATSQPTATLIPTLTQTSTPAPTPLPYESLIPQGWAQHRTALHEIWTPPGYKSAKADPLVLGLGSSPILDLSLSHSASSKSANKIYITVSYEPFTGDAFDQFINARLMELGLTVSERSKVDVNTVPATRLVFSERKGSNLDVNELTYIFLDGSTIWYVQYTAEIAEFYEALPDFESSAQTFRVVK